MGTRISLSYLPLNKSLDLPAPAPAPREFIQGFFFILICTDAE